MEGGQERSWLRAPSGSRATREKLGSAELLAGALPGSRTAAAVSHGWHRQAGFIPRSAMTTTPQKKKKSLFLFAEQFWRALSEKAGLAPAHRRHRVGFFPFLP